MPEPPLPISATIDARNDVVITFDRPLVPGVSAGANWFIRRANNSRSVAGPAVIAGSTVAFATGFPVPNMGADVVSYFAAPPDVVGTNGAPVAAFADFPLVLVP